MGFDDDPRIRELLAASATWHRLEHHREVTSTQDVALEQLRAGHPPGLVVVADAQRTGRGRLGRPWRDAVEGASGPANLAVTATVPAPVRALGLVPLAVGDAVAAAYEQAGAQPRLKWPNDVLLEDRKAAGILVERHQLAAGQAVLLIGCGLNLDWRGIERDAESQGWGSLAEAIDAEVDRVAILVDLLTSLAARLGELHQAPDRVLAAYRSRCATLGQQVRIDQPGRAPLTGAAVDLDPDGRLVVQVEGRREVVDVGDVAHVRPAAGPG